MLVHESDPSGASEGAQLAVRFCCEFKEFVTRHTGIMLTRAVCSESYSEVAARHPACRRCRDVIEESQRRCGNPFGKHQHRVRSKLQRVNGPMARRFPALAACKHVCVYCLLTAKREQRQERRNWRTFEGSTDKIKEQLQSLGLCRDDVRRGIVQIMKRPHVALTRLQMNDHWKNNNNHFWIKDIPQTENYDSSDSNYQRSLSLHDADEEETEDIILKEKQKEERYLSNSSLAVSKVENIQKNFNSDPSSSLQVNFNIGQNLFKVLKTKDKFSRNNVKFKKRNSLPAILVQQKKAAKRSRAHSDNLSTTVDTSSSLKLILKKDHLSQEYRISPSNIRFPEPKNILRIVDVNSENKSLLENNSDSTGNVAQLNDHLDKTVPELELNDTRPVNIPVDRNNLENSLSSFLKSKLKRNLRDGVEVERKRQKLTDDSVSVNINLNITVNSLSEGTSHTPLELMSSNDNSKVLLPNTNADICSTSDFSSCSESNDENKICPKLNSNISTFNSSYLKKFGLEKNFNRVNSIQNILQLDCNYNQIYLNRNGKEITKTKKTSLKKSEGENASNENHQENLSANGNLKFVFNNLFGEISDASGTEEDIIRNKRRKSKENKINQSVTNSIAESVEKNQSKNEKVLLSSAKQDKSKLKDIKICSLTAIENIEEINYSKTEISNVESSDRNKNSEILSVDNNVQTAKLPDNQVLLPKQIVFEKNHGNKETNSNITGENIPRQIDELKKSCDSEEINSYNTDENILKKVDGIEKKCNSNESNFNDSNDFSSKDQVIPDCLPVYDQVNLESGDFEFASSIHKFESNIEYSDDEYNNYSDFDAEYEESKTIECSNDVELIEFPKNPSINLNLQDCKGVSTHNLNKLPSFYNKDVTNYVEKDIDVDDDDVEILDHFRPVSDAKNKRRNSNSVMYIKSETVINLVSDGEVTDIEEIVLEEMNDNLFNSNTEGASEIYQLTESNDNIDNNLEIPNAIEKTQLQKQSLNISDFDVEKLKNKETVSSVALAYPEKSESSTEVILNENIIPVSDTIFRNTLEDYTNSSHGTLCSVDTVLHNIIQDTLKPDSSEKSADSHKSNIDCSEHVLKSISETVYPSTLSGDDSEGTLDENRESVSPNNLVIDETAGNDDSNMSNNRMLNSESSENNLNSCNTGNLVNKDTLSTNDLKSEHTIRFFENVDSDLNNPNILQKFNLSKEIIGLEEIKSEAITSNEQEICENLLEELKKNTSNDQEQMVIQISINETPNRTEPHPILINVTVEDPEKLNESSDWMDIGDLNKKGSVAKGPFKCRDINELLAKPVNNKTEANVAEALKLKEPQFSTSNNSNSTVNMVYIQNNNNSNSKINSQNDLVQSNIPEPICILPRPNNQLHNMSKQMPSVQGCILQQLHQPVFNAANAFVNPQYTPQMVISNSMQNNQNLSQRNLQNFTSAISNNIQNQQILLQGNSQNLESVISKNIQNRNLPLRNLENVSSFSNKEQNQNLPQRMLQNFRPNSEQYNISQENTSLIFASSMFTKEFAKKNAVPTISSEPQMSSVANLNTTDVFSLPPVHDVTLHKPLRPRDNQKTRLSNVHYFRKNVLQIIEADLQFLRKHSNKNLDNYYETLIYKKTLTQDVWNFQLRIFNIMKCFHAICSTTAEENIETILFATYNSLKQFETPETKGTVNLMNVYECNKNLKECGYQFKDTKECMNYVLSKLEYFTEAEILTNTMSIEQQNQFWSQVHTYNSLVRFCPKNLEGQNVTNNFSVKDVAIISNNSTNHNSLQKSSLSDTEKKQSILSISNVSVQKSIDQAHLNNPEISITLVGSKNKEANTKSILDNLNHTCIKCEKTSEIICSNCLSAEYCSRECQYNHWKEIHYKTCENTSF